MSVTPSTIRGLQQSWGDSSIMGPDYDEKMFHPIPAGSVIDRGDLVAELCKDKVVLSLGATGPTQERIDAASKRCFGVDIQELDREDFMVLDLDDPPEEMPWLDQGIELIVAGEVLEHLCNPGNILKKLRGYGCIMVVTVPNAFTSKGQYHASRGVENVNLDHVAYYSYWTLRGLMRKTGWEVVAFFWYEGKPIFSEGLIFVVR